MKTRSIRFAGLSLLMTLANVSAALAHGGGGEDTHLLSWDSLALAIMTSCVVGAVCFAVMVWDPSERSSARRSR